MLKNVAKKSIWDKKYKHQEISGYGILKQLRITMKYLLKKKFNFQIFQISYISYYMYLIPVIKKNTCWYVIWPKIKNNGSVNLSIICDQIQHKCMHEFKSWFFKISVF